jgi:hypothetical protein
MWMVERDTVRRAVAPKMFWCEKGRGVGTRGKRSPFLVRVKKKGGSV